MARRPEQREEGTLDHLPSVWQREASIRKRIKGKQLAVFLDYDGTLSPIVDDPEHAELGDDMRAAIAALARSATVAIVSGRDLEDLRARVGLDRVFLAGSHGFDIAGPQGWQETLEKGTEFLPDLDQAEHALRERLDAVAGALVERKKFAIAVHYRRVRERDLRRVEDSVDAVLDAHPRLLKEEGKKVLRLQPRIDWDKGYAVDWLLDRLHLGPGVLPLYIGDDLTDEDAFRRLAGRGIRIVVRDGERPTAADLTLADTDDVRRFLGWLKDAARK